MDNLLKSTNKLYNISKCLHTGNVFNSKTRQIGNAMKKILGNQKKKYYPGDSPSMPNPNVFSKGSYEGKYSNSSKRATVLNKLFMRNITDLMSIGECSTKVLGLGIEVNRVQITPDYKILKVYWIARGTKNDEVIETTLNKVCRLLRHELSQLRVMGEVPTIQFVKDKHYSQIVELESRLASADFGDDYEPEDVSNKFKSELQLLTSLENSIKDKIITLEADSSNIDEEEAALPPMPQNVLGLNHAHILNKMKLKTDTTYRLSENKNQDNWVGFKVSQAINEDPVAFSSNYSQREAFKDFLQKRNILRNKVKDGVAKNYIPDVEIIKEELHERHLDYFDRNFPNLENDFEDYLDEDNEAK